MNASLAIGCCLAIFNAGPQIKLSQPPAAQARAVPSAVIPIAHLEVAEGKSQLPPAPTPRFTEGDTLQIEFEFSQPESCHDSEAFLPAPPAENDVSHALRRPSSAAPVWRLRLPSRDIQPTAAGDEPSPLTPPAELQSAGDRLQHLRQAMHHLHAAGLRDLAEDASDAYLTALQDRRQQLLTDLQETTQELHRVTEEFAGRSAAPTWTAEPTRQRLRPLSPLTFPLPVPGSEIAPSSNSTPAPEPMSALPTSPTPLNSTPLKLINPSFYVGEAPPRVVDAWQQAFVPDGPKTAIAPTPELRFRAWNGTGQRFELLRMLVPAPEPKLGPATLTYPAPPESPEPEFDLPPAPLPEVQLEAKSEPVA